MRVTPFRVLRKLPSVAVPVAVALVLAACGGGQTSGADAANATSPSAAVSTLRAHALSVSTNSAVAPAEAARQLMDFAEQQFAVYFPSPQGTQTLGPFHYRYYAQTGIYLGVVVVADQGYEYLGVYVMGGPFGNAPLFVGPLIQFITPVQPGSGGGPTGYSNGCFETAGHDPTVPGTRVVEVSRAEESGIVTTVESRTAGPVVFEGHAAVETRIAWIEGSYPAAVPDAEWQKNDTRTYQMPTGSGELTIYGHTAAISDVRAIPGGGTLTSTSNSRTILEPPSVDRQAQLPLGGSLTYSTRTRSIHSSTSVYAGGPVQIPPVVMPPTETVADSPPTTVTFVRRESLTVPLGTFQACVYRYDTAISTGEVWIADGRGFNLKTVGTAGGVTSTTVTLAVTINGQAVTP